MRTLATLAAVLLGAWPLMAQTDLSDPAEPWLEQPVGVSTEVPHPFEPLAVDGDTVSCWGREYSLAVPFPAQITSQGEELLAAPVRLIIEVAGQTHQVAGLPATVGEARDDRVEFFGAGEPGPIAVSAEGWLEYDGLMQIALTASGDATVDRLTIEVPVRPEIAQFMHSSKRWGQYVYERVGEPGRSWRPEGWQSLVWLGDHERGLTFVTERPGLWVGPPEQAIQVERSDAAVVLRANLIGEPTAIEGERSWTIGLQATPGKPLPVGWHGRHVGSGGIVTPEKAERMRELGQTVALMWNSLTTYFSYPEPADPEAFRDAVQAYHDAGIRVVVYVTLSGTGPSAVRQRHLGEWLMSNAEGEPLFASTQGNEVHVSTCAASTYSDWLVWAVDCAMEDYDLDGVYIDNAGPYYCYNEAHGCGGAHGVRYPYFATRDLHKRLWTVIHGRKPEQGLIWEHNSRTSNSLNLTFVDVYSDGEHFRVKSKGTPEQITRLLLDITGTGRQWGAQPCFLPSALNLREQYTDWLIGRLLPFGNVMMSVPSWFDYSRLVPVQQARLDFGLATEPVEWFTPEAPPAWLPITPEEVWVGGYRREDNRVLLTVTNPTAERLQARVNLHAAEGELGGPVVATDALTGAPTTRLGPNLVLCIPADSFRVVLIEPAQ